VVIRIVQEIRQLDPVKIDQYHRDRCLSVSRDVSHVNGYAGFLFIAADLVHLSWPVPDKSSGVIDNYLSELRYLP
jgi:hypothetical protein